MAKKSVEKRPPLKGVAIQGEQLAYYRKLRNWTQAELEAQSGVPLRTIQYAEASESIVPQNLYDLSVALGIPAELFTQSYIQSSPPPNHVDTTITKEGDYAVFVKSGEVLDLVEKLRNRVGKDRSIYVICIAPGNSVAITLRLHTEDYYILVDLFQKRLLADLGIVAISPAITSQPLGLSVSTTKDAALQLEVIWLTIQRAVGILGMLLGMTFPLVKDKRAWDIGVAFCMVSYGLARWRNYSSKADALALAGILIALITARFMFLL